MASDAAVVDDVPGSGGLLGVRRANELAAAGEPTLLLATPTTHVLLPLQRGDEGTPASAFIPLIGLGSAPNVLLVSRRLGVRDVAGLVERARAQPLTYASAGAGQTIHLCTALFCELAAVAMSHRPYDRGSATAYADLEAGVVHVYFDNVLACRDAIDAGIVVPLAVSADRRSPLLPSVPTLAECGFARHSLDLWFGVFGANMDGALRAAVESLVGDDRLTADLGALGLCGGPQGGPELARAIDASRPRWRAALDAA